MTELLTPQDIAQILGMSKTYVRDRLVKRPDFPRPAISLSQKTRRWSQVDVRSWMQRQNEQISR